MLFLAAFSASAAVIDADTKASLTVNCTVEGDAVPGHTFRIYKAGHLDNGYVFTLEAPFSGYSVTFGEDESGWGDAAYTLYGYVVRDGIHHTDLGTTEGSPTAPGR